MKKFFILIALLTAAVSFAGAQKMAAKETTEQALMRMEKEIAAGLLKGDTAAFEKYIADSATLVDPLGMRAGKAEVVAVFKSGAIKFETMDVSDLKVMIYGDTAIVTYQTMDKGTFKNPATGKEIKIDNKTQWTDTFINMKGKWMIVATQGTTIMEM